MSMQPSSLNNNMPFDDSLPFEVTICTPDLDSKPMKFCNLGDKIISLLQSKKPEDISAAKKGIQYIERRYQETGLGKEKLKPIPFDISTMKAVNIWVARVEANEREGSPIKTWTARREICPGVDADDFMLQRLTKAETITSTSLEVELPYVQTIIRHLVENQKQIHGEGQSEVNTEEEIFQHINKWRVASTAVDHCTVWPFLPKGICIRYAYAVYLARTTDYTPYAPIPLGVESVLWGHTLMEADDHFTFNETVGRLHCLAIMTDYINAIDGHVAYGGQNIVDWCKEKIEDVPIWNQAMVLQQLDLMNHFKAQRNKYQQNLTFSCVNDNGKLSNADEDLDIDSLRWMDASLSPIVTAWCTTRNFVPNQGPRSMYQNGCGCFIFGFNAWYRVHDIGDVIFDVCYNEMMNENRLWWGSCRYCNDTYARAIMQFPLLINCPMDDEHQDVVFLTVAAHICQLVIPRYGFFLQLWRGRNMRNAYAPMPNKCNKNCNFSFIYGKRQRKPLTGEALMHAFSVWATGMFGVETFWERTSVPQAHQKWSDKQTDLCPHQKSCSNFVKWFQGAIEKAQNESATLEEVVAMQSTLYSEFRTATECACEGRNLSANKMLQCAIYAVVLTNEAGWDVINGRLPCYKELDSNGKST